MGLQVVAGAILQCAYGAAPSTLAVPPTNRVMVGGPPAATIMDHAPGVNIAPFGMCNSPSNPTVAAATATALGVLTPMPCTPMTPAPWAPGSPDVLIGGIVALNNLSQCLCAWGGTISVQSPGQTQTMVP